MWESVSARFRSPRGLVLGMVVLALLVAGVVWWVQPAGVPRVVSGTVQASVLSSQEVSRVVGTTLNAETRTSQPATPLAADPPGCSVAVGPATAVVYQRGWTAFLSVTIKTPTPSPSTPRPKSSASTRPPNRPELEFARFRGHLNA